jgi:hypothetical protein
MSDHNPYLWDKSGPKDPEVERLEKLVGALGYRAVSRKSTTVGYLYIGFAMAATMLLFWAYDFTTPLQPSDPLWSVHALAGAPQVSAGLLDEVGEIGVGQWLITDDTSAAMLDVGTLGKVRTEPNSRLRLQSTQAGDYRLYLAEGMVYASIWAPPRTFAIETPSALVVDLGCEYALTVNDNGNGVLCVESGWVSLEHNDRVSVVPTGAQCELRQGVGPGTPYLAGASLDYIHRLRRFDFESSGRSDISELIELATECEVFSLVHLVDRVDASQRGVIYDRLALVHPPRPGITREGIVALDVVMVAEWRDQFECYESDVCRASCMPEPF